MLRGRVGREGEEKMKPAGDTGGMMTEAEQGGMKTETEEPGGMMTETEPGDMTTETEEPGGMTRGDTIEEIMEVEEAALLPETNTVVMKEVTEIALFIETGNTLIETAEMTDRTGEMSITDHS